MATMTIQIRRKGLITLPVAIRRQYDLSEGDVFALVDLGDGCLLLTPQVSQLAGLGDRVARLVEDEGVTTEEMLEALEEERETYYQEHYA